MVEVLAAVVENSGGVFAPVGGISRDSHGVRLNGALYICASFDGAHRADLEASSVVCACASSGSVGVLALTHKSVIFDVGEALVVESSVAALVSVGFGAVNDLLLGEIDGLALEKGP